MRNGTAIEQGDQFIYRMDIRGTCLWNARVSNSMGCKKEIISASFNQISNNSCCPAEFADRLDYKQYTYAGSPLKATKRDSW